MQLHLGLISGQGFGQVAEDPVGTDHHWCRCGLTAVRLRQQRMARYQR